MDKKYGLNTGIIRKEEMHDKCDFYTRNSILQNKIKTFLHNDNDSARLPATW